MSRFFVDLEGRPDQAATALTEVFNLDDQLAAAGDSTASDTDNRNDIEGSAP
jgi:L-rhamnose mutarotase